MLNANGVLIQGLDDKTTYAKSFPYHGINAYYQFPLTWLKDDISKKLSDETQFKRIDEYWSSSLELISDPDLYNRYIRHCTAMNVKFRALFMESNYSDEFWTGALPNMEFMGYEYCPIPIDEQIITDLDWYKPFFRFHKLLNHFGLFRTYADAEMFAKAYNEAFLAGKVGDGEMDSYIIRVSRICMD